MTKETQWKTDMFAFEDDVKKKKESNKKEEVPEEPETPDEIELTSIGIISDHNQGWYKRYPKKAIIDKNNQPTVDYFKWYLEVINSEELNLIRYDKLSEENKKIFDERTKKDTITFKEDKPTEEVIPVKALEEEVEKMKKQRAENEKKNIKIIIEATGLTEKEIREKAEDKQKELKGLITIEGAIYLIGKELGCNMPEPTTTKKTKKETKSKANKKEETFAFEGDKKETPKQEITIINNIVHTKEIVEGKIYNTVYDSYETCHICHEKRWISGQTMGCLVCDKVMTIDAYQKYLNSLAKNIPKQESKPMKAEIVEEKPTQDQEVYSIIPIPQQQAIIQQRPLTLEERKQMIKDTIELYRFTIENMLEKPLKDKPNISTDYILHDGKKALTRAGCNKLALVFNISVETLWIKIDKEYDSDGKETDIIATACVKATRQNGTHIIITGQKAKSEFKGNLKYNLHILKAIAETRAFNRAITNAVGYTGSGVSAVTAEEMSRKEDNNEDDMFKF